jgi:hypothetical protein
VCIVRYFRTAWYENWRRSLTFGGCSLTAGLYDMPHDPLRHAVSPCLARTANAPKHAAIAHTSGDKPLIEFGSGICQSALAWSALSQLPRRTPRFFGPLARRMPAARSELNRPESAASYASRLTAASLPLIVPGASWRDSR